MDIPHLTINAVKKGLQMVDDLVVYSLKFDYFLESCLNFNLEMVVVEAPYRPSQPLACGQYFA
jgi:hypothetical protein